MHKVTKNGEKKWNGNGYFEEGMPIRIGWLGQFIAVHERMGWDVAKVHPELNISKILEQEVVDRGVIGRFLEYGYQHAGYAYPLACARVANWTALGEIGWVMLYAPTLRHAFGALSTYISLVDTRCSIETTDDKDRFVLRVLYDIEDRKHRDVSNLVFASSLEKFINSFHGDVQRGNNVNIALNCTSVPAWALQEAFWSPLINVGRANASEISLEIGFASKRNINFDKGIWEASRGGMRRLFGAEYGMTKSERYAQLMQMNVMNWNYQQHGKPSVASICENLKISERGMRNLLAESGTSPKEVMMHTEARRIYLAIKRGHSMTDAAEIYQWSNVTNMKKMVNDYLQLDLKKIKPYDYVEN